MLINPGCPQFFFKSVHEFGQVFQVLLKYVVPMSLVHPQQQHLPYRQSNRSEILSDNCHPPLCHFYVTLVPLQMFQITSLQAFSVLMKTMTIFYCQSYFSFC